MASIVHSSIRDEVINHILFKYGGKKHYVSAILYALKKLLKGTYKRYEFPKDDIIVNDSLIQVDNFQLNLSKINEKGLSRKSSGVYYTDRDVTDYMVLNAFNHFVSPSLCSLSYTNTIENRFQKFDTQTKVKLLEASVFDPTCGAGEFLISALTLKLQLLGINENAISKTVDLIDTIKGNDIDETSTDISKIRLFFFLIDSFAQELDLDSIAKTLDRNFCNVDAVNYTGNVFAHYDIIVGNPPFIEYGKYEGSVVNDYGNVYADVMQNVSPLLNTNGVLSFVVPLSYISTARMSAIREYVQVQTGKQLLINFADRPDCLFTGVHQKLTIVFAQKVATKVGVFSSKYYHWYKTERELLFQNIPLVKINTTDTRYWPKLGDVIASSIFSKIQKFDGIDFLSSCNSKRQRTIYINLRACFWMKAFSFDMHSNSYKPYCIDNSKVPFVLCLFNSSLFFLIWTIISDGWHITNKELTFIKLPRIIPKPKKWTTLQKNLETKLEETKVYVGTKQIDYEYKHRFCKKIIDEIDKELQSVYGLSDEEVKYIQTFNEKYRISNGA